MSVLLFNLFRYRQPVAYDGSWRTRFPSGASASALFACDYQRDALGRITGKTEILLGETHILAYAYDALGRLEQVAANGEPERSYGYDPKLGRWLSKDPIGISGGLDQYVFCENNPTNNVDPNGEFAIAGAIFREISGFVTDAALQGVVTSC